MFFIAHTVASTEALGARGIRLVVAEQNRELVERLRERNVPAVSGDATEPSVLIQAHVARASLLVVATPNTFQVRKMVEIALAITRGVLERVDAASAPIVSA